MIKIYTAKYCPYCEQVITLLFRKGASFEVIDVTKDAKIRNLITEISGLKTIPQVFINGEFVGGCSRLQELEKEGKLDTLLKEGDNAE